MNFLLHTYKLPQGSLLRVHKYEINGNLGYISVELLQEMLQGEWEISH